MKKLFYLFLILGLFACSDKSTGDNSQNNLNNDTNINELSFVTFLDNNIEESSGLLLINENLISLNDSGGENTLYELDISTGNISGAVNIDNSVNIDWEDIACDSDYIYIGDFGNNNGNRTDLTIYKVSINDYINNTDSSIVAEEINFSYSDQITFISSPYNTNYDAEALISYNDNLYVFTKNWVNGRTNIYSIPKNPGTYSVSKIGSIDVDGLITAADYDSNKIVLLGYNSVSPFLVEIENFDNADFSNALIDRFQLVVPQGYSSQTEGIIYLNNYYYISAEENSGSIQVLYRIDRNNLISD